MQYYCLPLICDSTKEINAAIQKHHPTYDFFEIWLDYLGDVSTSWLVEISAEWGERLIFVTRRLRLEPIQIPFRHRMMILGVLAKTKAKVDFDVGTQREELSFWRSCGSMDQVLLSFHDYVKTPGDGDLRELFSYMAKNKPWICKAATMCQTSADGVRLLQWIQSFPKEYPEQPFIILGMGRYGRCTRVFGPLWGNAFTFAPANMRHASAPGQISRRQYETLFQILGE